MNFCKKITIMLSIMCFICFYSNNASCNSISKYNTSEIHNMLKSFSQYDEIGKFYCSPIITYEKGEIDEAFLIKFGEQNIVAMFKKGENNSITKLILTSNNNNFNERENFGKIIGCVLYLIGVRRNDMDASYKTIVAIHGASERQIWNSEMKKYLSFMVITKNEEGKKVMYVIIKENKAEIRNGIF